MIIIDQDKCNILNFDTTVYIGIEETSKLNDVVRITAETKGNGIVLGRYKNEERAKEVLNEIIQTKTNFEYYKYADESHRNEVDTYMRTKYNFFDTYEMPIE